EQAAGQAREWVNNLPVSEDFFVSVNLSPSQLATEALLNDMKALVNEHRAVASHLKLEITETQVMTNPEHSAYMLDALKRMGLGLALDDFGTGHSSLSYLHRFPFDTIKIPAPFVQMGDDSGMSHTQVPIIRSVVALATELDLIVIAEGVETDEEIERLQMPYGHYAEGYAFGASLRAAGFGKRLAQELGR